MLENESGSQAEAPQKNVYPLARENVAPRFLVFLSLRASANHRYDRALLGCKLCIGICRSFLFGDWPRFFSMEVWRVESCTPIFFSIFFSCSCGVQFVLRKRAQSPSPPPAVQPGVSSAGGVRSRGVRLVQPGTAFRGCGHGRAPGRRTCHPPYYGPVHAGVASSRGECR